MTLGRALRVLRKVRSAELDSTGKASRAAPKR